MRRWLVLVLLLAALLPLTAALAEEARDVTAECAVTMGGKKVKWNDMKDRRYSTYVTVKKGGVIEVDGKGTPITALQLQFFDRATDFEIQAEQGGEWVTLHTGGEYLSDGVSLPEGAPRLRILNTDKARMFLCELKVWTGEAAHLPQRWEAPGKADLMLLSAHCDDELLWFGGMLPLYAGERQLKVQVAYLVPSTTTRRLEMLDALWTCGVTTYPLFADMRDVRSSTLKGQYRLWNRGTLQERVVAMIRRVQPEVLVTHDFEGEYGHGAHRAAADIAVRAMEAAADKTKHRDSFREHGAWQVKKLYVHLYPENEVVMDWHVPLSRFGGRDAFDVAQEAFQCHASQVRNGWAIEDGGEYDNRRFGLYFTAVGPDTGACDLMENIE